jgi:hypothetical protein
MVATDHIPARFDVKGFPEQAVFDRMFENFNGTSVTIPAS